MVNCFTHVTTVLDKKLKTDSPTESKIPESASSVDNTWLKEELKELDSVDCFMACYRSLSQIDYIQHKSKIKRNKKGKKAKLETTNVIIRPNSKSKKLPKFYPNLVNFKTFPKIFGKICKLIIIDYYSHFFE